jgi:FkbM family methyltransferase
MRAASWLSRALPAPARRALYRLGPVSNGLRRILTLAAPEAFTVVEIASGTLRGASLELDLKSEKTIWLGMYEPELQQAIERFAPEGGIAYDIGANLGYISLALARRLGPHGKVIAFEPLPENLRRLNVNLDLNPEGRQVQVIASAVGDRTGRTTFLVHRSGGMGKLAGSKGRSAAYNGELTVDTVVVDEWIQDNKLESPNLVKIDVEGGETQVLKGMERLLRSAQPVLLLELHGPEAAAESLEILLRAGYSIHDMRPGYPALERVESWKAYIVALPAASSGNAEP